MFAFLNKLEVRYRILRDVALKRSAVVPFMITYSIRRLGTNSSKNIIINNILDNIVFIEASQTWRLEYFS